MDQDSLVYMYRFVELQELQRRKTVRKKLRLKLKELNLWIKDHRHQYLKDIFTVLNQKLRGHYQYYGITDNSPSIGIFYFCATKMLYKWINRRSQKKSYTWEGFRELLKIFPLATPHICVNIYG